MARLLFTVWPYPTHLHPFLALALEARARGHEVAFYTGGEGLSLMAGEGFRCLPFQDVDWDTVARTIDHLIARRRRLFRIRRLWASFLVETVPAQVRDLEAALAEWPADALICDIVMWAPMLVLHERRGIPVVPFSHVASCILPGSAGPIPGIALPRARHALRDLAAAIAARAAALVTARSLRKANALRRRFGLPALNVSVTAFTGTLPLYLVPGAPELDHGRPDLPPSVRYVGPCLWDGPPDQPPPAWVGEIPAGRPCVLVDEGALYTREPRLLRMAARALADLPLSVVLLAGRGRDPSALDLGPLASNVTLRPHAPLSGLLPRAQALIANGNTEPVLAALQAGLPLVVLPSIWDQAELAWRVQESGVGLRLASWTCTPPRMRQAVQRVLEEPAFRERAAAMRAALARQGGPARAVRLIEDLLRARP